MRSRLKDAVITRDADAVKQILSSLEDKDNWSLVTIIDELLPLALMESNLRYGSFHQVKMGLFLRRIAIEGWFSKETEKALARLIALETARREWVGIRADRIGTIGRDLSSPLERMIEEIDKGNVHNAFYYALGLLEQEPKTLVQTLLTLGASAIPKTLGHSLSCFFPVVEDVIEADHPQAPSALLSYVMFLSRYPADREVLKEGYGRAKMPLDFDVFLKRCASGNGIVDIHHTITFYITTQWARATFNESGSVPYGVIWEWVGEKEIDQERERRVAVSNYEGKLPDTYDEFSRVFSLEYLDETTSCVLRMLEESPKEIVDWLFRVYASYYKDGWDPHYYTSLYSALRLYVGEKMRDEVARRMAVEQALYYFADGMR